MYNHRIHYPQDSLTHRILLERQDDVPGLCQRDISEMDHSLVDEGEVMSEITVLIIEGIVADDLPEEDIKGIL